VSYLASLPAKAREKYRIKRSTNLLLTGLLALLCYGCAPVSEQRPPAKEPGFDDIRDSAPARSVDTSHVPDAIPRHEVRTIAGNKNPYTVLGKTYHLIEDERSYKERGKASWYGKKFHGRRTSNGEIYDMYAMTAAHKTLPIPSYVRVTNVTNGRSAVVRVNDRGPFHADRIIDLSYAAAQRLGILTAGTGLVDVEIILSGDAAPTAGTKQALNQVAPGSELPPNTYLQIGAFSSEASARQFAADVGRRLNYPVILSRTQTGNVVYRVRVGPLANARHMQDARDQVQLLNIPQPHVVYE
jgi:rare lipoprotein A